MKILCFQAPPGTIAAAESALAAYLPGLDVQLLEYGAGMALLPSHLLRALEIEYGAREALAILRSAGLTDGRHVALREVVEWGRVHADLWMLRRVVAPGEFAVARGPDWPLVMCRVEEAWRAVGGPDQIDWGTVRVGQIDTGYTQHRVYGFPGPSWIDVAGARTFVPDPPPAGGIDPLSGASGGHGTSSGSVSCGLDLVEPYRGVAPRVPWVPARINECVIIDDRAEEFEAATRYLVDEARVDAINVSMGTFLKAAAPEPIRRAVDHCYECGVVMVGAAGNVPLPGARAFPAALPRALAVGGVTSEAVPWAMSSYGAWVDFSAPAKAVKRANMTNEQREGYTDSFGGTTFAAAMTSGAVALWLLAHGAQIAQRYREPWQRIEAFRKMARDTAWAPPGWRPDHGFGAGILNVGGLMDTAALPDVAQLIKH
jgi:Subtilase family